MEELKGNFFRVELQFTHKKMAEQKLQRKKILDAEHCAWLMVLAKTRPEFDHNLFLRIYPEMISKILEIREIVGFRLDEWDNSNPRDPVRIVKNQLANREKLHCQNVDDNDVQPNSNNASKHNTHEESLTGNVNDNECNQTVQRPQKMVHAKNPQKAMENAQVRILLVILAKSSSFGSRKWLKQYKSN